LTQDPARISRMQSAFATHYMKSGKQVLIGRYGWCQPNEQRHEHGDFDRAEVDEAWAIYSAHWAFVEQREA